MKYVVNVAGDQAPPPGVQHASYWWCHYWLWLSFHFIFMIIRAPSWLPWAGILPQWRNLCYLQQSRRANMPVGWFLSQSVLMVMVTTRSPTCDHVLDALKAIKESAARKNLWWEKKTIQNQLINQNLTGLKTQLKCTSHCFITFCFRDIINYWWEGWGDLLWKLGIHQKHLPIIDLSSMKILTKMIKVHGDGDFSPLITPTTESSTSIILKKDL